MFPPGSMPEEKKKFQELLDEIFQDIPAPEVQEWSYGFWAGYKGLDISWARGENQIVVWRGNLSFSLSIEGLLPKSNLDSLRQLIRGSK